MAKRKIRDKNTNNGPQYSSCSTDLTSDTNMLNIYKNTIIIYATNPLSRALFCENVLIGREEKLNNAHESETVNQTKNTTMGKWKIRNKMTNNSSQSTKKSLLHQWHENG